MWLVIILAFHLAGAGSALSAIFTARTSQGAVAWSLALLLVPYGAVPAYWLLGASRFQGYVNARRHGASRLDRELRSVVEELRDCLTRPEGDRGTILVAERLARLPVLGGNASRLLLDGEETFRDIFAGIRDARHSIVVQYYIIRDDDIGRELQSLLIQKARAGVAVHLLFDKIGSHALPGRFVRALEEAGVKVSPFRSTRMGRPTRFQINFRNHRKIVVADGRVGWVGGLNVGDEYLGRDPEIGPWRDTHLRVEGPAALALQLAFVEDWYWATGSVPDLVWEPVRVGEESILVLPSGPADEVDTVGLLIQAAFHGAKQRIWVASPYFVPDDGVLEALKLAAFRGVDVRVLIPERSDSRLVDLARVPALEELLRQDVRTFCYASGFLHAKVILVDDRVAGVGTVNLDYRSIRLNFEITALVFDESTIGEVAASFEEDFRGSTELTLQELSRRRLPSRVASRVAHLFAPVL